MIGIQFTLPQKNANSPFDTLFNVLKQLLTYTSGDFNEAFSWLTELDKTYKLTTPDYGLGDFMDELKERGYIKENEEVEGDFFITAKTEQSIRKQALEQIFGKLKKGKSGNHRTKFIGVGDEQSTDTRPFEFGDAPDQIALLESMRNAQIQHGIGEFKLTESDLEVRDREYKTQTSTVLMIDVSHSMILYGEARGALPKICRVISAKSRVVTPLSGWRFKRGQSLASCPPDPKRLNSVL